MLGYIPVPINNYNTMISEDLHSIGEYRVPSTFSREDRREMMPHIPPPRQPRTQSFGTRGYTALCMIKLASQTSILKSNRLEAFIDGFA
jgi:hypothetical protein